MQPGDLTLSIRRQEHTSHVWIRKAEGKFIYVLPLLFKNIEEIIEEYRKSDLMTKDGQTIRLSVKDQDTFSTKKIKSTNSIKKRTYMKRLSRKDCETKLMKSESGNFLIREIDEVHRFLSFKGPNTYQIYGI